MLRVVLVLVLLGAAMSARAEAAPDDYGGLIRRAVTEYQAGAWEEARALFRQAHTLEPSARTLRGLALTAYELHRYVACVLEFEAALAHPARPLDAAQRAEAESLLARARAFLSSYTLELEPAGAELFIDGAPPVLRDGKVLLDPGVHSLVAQAAGHKQVHLQLQVGAGSERSLRIVLEPNVAPAVAVAPGPPSELHDQPPRPAPVEAVRHPYAWGLGAAGVATLGAGLSLWLVARDKSQDVNQNRCDGDCASERSRGRALERGAYAAFGIGAALSGAALTVYVLKGRQKARITAGLAPQHVWLGARF